ncbi:MAG: hypothetical protein AAFP19_12405 [Bacteroidota bacterium]
MESEMIIYMTWWRFLTSALLLLLGYFLLQVAYRGLGRLSFLERFQPLLRERLRQVLLLYELIALLVLLSIFILINPIFHGLLTILFLLLVLVGGFKPLKSYFAGKIVQLNGTIDKGIQLKVNNLQGIIVALGRFGIQLKTSKGLHILSYDQLLIDGYMLLSGEEIGGFYQLKISPSEGNERKDHGTYLTDLLATTPYLDWSHKPEISIGQTPEQVIATVLVKEESHLYDLIALLDEWGYVCKLSKK